MKRFNDLTFSLILILLLLPVFVAVGIIVRLTIGSPIIFKQVRAGKRGKPFELYKFRTMTNERNQYGQLLPDAERIHPIGAWLRKMSLDELPQLLNVLKGELSLVGPRPLLMEYLPLYTPSQARRHEVKPGITGWAQINGRNSVTWEEKFRLDTWYVDHQSIWLDFKILVFTIAIVARSEGISQKGRKTMSKFQGTKKEKASGGGAV